jgi:hypothetical protein
VTVASSGYGADLFHNGCGLPEGVGRLVAEPGMPQVGLALVGAVLALGVGGPRLAALVAAEVPVAADRAAEGFGRDVGAVVRHVPEPRPVGLRSTEIGRLGLTVGAAAGAVVGRDLFQSLPSVESDHFAPMNPGPGRGRLPPAWQGRKSNWCGGSWSRDGGACPGAGAPQRRVAPYGCTTAPLADVALSG